MVSTMQSDEIDSIGHIATMMKNIIPDDIIINIFSRLPTKKVMQFRLVCRRWRDLTSLCRNSVPPPTILVANPSSSNFRLELFCLDKWWELERKKLISHSFPFHFCKLSHTCRALFSHEGLVVIQLKGEPYTWEHNVIRYIILNPTRRETVRIIFSNRTGRKSEIYGVFFHHFLKEYCSLWNIVTSPKTQPKKNNFKMLILGKNPRFKEISNPYSHRFKWHGSYPIIIDQYLYWMLEPEQGNKTDNSRSDIMEFSILNEEFRVLSCPVPLGNKCSLLNIDGTLSYVKIYPNKIAIWRLEHLVDQLWTSAEYTFNIKFFDEGHSSHCRCATAVVDGKLALLAKQGLLVCNLMEGTVKKYPESKSNNGVLFLSHHMSLASLKHCKPKIFIDHDGQIVVCGKELSKG